MYTTQLCIKQTVKDRVSHWLPTDWALNDLVSTELTCPVTTEEDTVLFPVHTHLTLGLRERGGRCVCVCVCVCVRERERGGRCVHVCEREREREREGGGVKCVTT